MNFISVAGYVGESVNVSNGCVFGAATKISQPTSIAENSVFYGEPLKHRIASERPAVRFPSLLTDLLIVSG